MLDRMHTACMFMYAILMHVHMWLWGDLSACRRAPGPPYAHVIDMVLTVNTVNSRLQSAYPPNPPTCYALRIAM